MYFSTYYQNWAETTKTLSYFTELHYVKKAHIRNYSGTHFPAFGLNTERYCPEYGKVRSISPYLVRMRKNADQNNSEYGHFSRSVVKWNLLSFATKTSINHGNKTKSDILPYDIVKSDVIIIFFGQRILKYFNNFQNRNFLVLWLKWTQKIEMKQNDTFFRGTSSYLTSFFVGRKILEYINDFYNYHLSLHNISKHNQVK